MPPGVFYDGNVFQLLRLCLFHRLICLISYFQGNEGSKVYWMKSILNHLLEQDSDHSKIGIFARASIYWPPCENPKTLRSLRQDLLYPVDPSFEMSWEHCKHQTLSQDYWAFRYPQATFEIEGTMDPESETSLIRYTKHQASYRSPQSSVF